MARITGTSKANTLIGTDLIDTILGLAGDDRLLGKAGNDTLDGGSGKDTLDGGTGRDSMIGGTGDDTYMADNALDKVVEKAGGGTDLVKSSVAHTLALNVESLTLIGAAAIKGTGNGLANTITGNSGNNILDGRAGADHMTGKGGNDTYVVDSAGDTVTEAAGGGTDLVKTTLTFYTLNSQIENLTYIGATAATLTGNALGNTITGGAGADHLAGSGVLSDHLIGGGGDDTYTAKSGDTITELAGGGIDRVDTAELNYTLAGELEDLNFISNGNHFGTGNELNNHLFGSPGGDDELLGLDGDDTLNGDVGNDTLDGGAGNDTLNAFGQDSLIGGTGADHFVYSGVEAAVSVIADFSQGSLDKIDISQIDANAIANGDQGFFFIGTTTFTGGFNSPEGEVRYVQDIGNNRTVVEFNLDDGGATADLTIWLTGIFTLTAADFIL